MMGSPANTTMAAGGVVRVLFVDVMVHQRTAKPATAIAMTANPTARLNMAPDFSCQRNT